MAATIKIKLNLVIFIALGILVVACNNQDIVSSVVTPVPIDTATSQPSATHTKGISVTSTATATYTPTPTLANISEPIKTPEPISPPRNIETITPTPTNTRLPPPTPLPTLLPSPTPRLPQEIPPPASVAGIGTAVPPAAGIITAENVTALTEAAQWGKGRIVDAAYSPDGSIIYALTELGVYVYDADTAQQLEYRPYDYEPRTMALSADGKTIAVVTRSNYIELRDAISNSFITAFSPFPNTDVYIRQLDFDQSGEFLFIAASGQVIVWDIAHAASVAEMSVLTSDGSYINFAISSLSNLVATGIVGDDIIQIWEWQDKEFVLVNELEIPESLNEEFYDLTISPDGRYVALGDLYMSIAVWQVEDEQLLYILNERQRNGQSKRFSIPHMCSGPGPYVIGDLKFSPDNQFLAETTGLNNLTLWQMSDGQPVQELAGVGHRIQFAPNSNIISAWNYSLSQWRVEDGRFINTLKQHIGSIRDLALRPEQGQIAISSEDGYIYLRGMNDGGLATSLRANVNYYSTCYGPYGLMDITSDGNTLVAAHNNVYGVWDLMNNQVVDLEPHPGGVERMAISFDGQYILANDADQSAGGFVLSWQTNTENEFQLTSSRNRYLGFVFSPTDMLLAATTYEDLFDQDEKYKLVLLQPDTDISQELLNGLDDPFFYNWIYSLYFSPNGRYLAVSSKDKNSNYYTLSFWTINNGQAEFSHSIDALHETSGIAISPNNKLLAINTDSVVSILDVNDGRILHTFSPSTAITDILFSADGRYLIIGDGYGTVRFWAVP